MHRPICTVTKTLTTIVNTHLYQFWFSTSINILMVAEICNFDHGHHLVTILIKIVYFSDWAQKLHFFLHHIIFAPPIFELFLHHIVTKSVLDFFLHHIVTPDLYFPAPNLPPSTCGDKLVLVDRVAHLSKLFLISNQLLLNFQAPTSQHLLASFNHNSLYY